MSLEVYADRFKGFVCLSLFYHQSQGVRQTREDQSAVMDITNFRIVTLYLIWVGMYPL